MKLPYSSRLVALLLAALVILYVGVGTGTKNLRLGWKDAAEERESFHYYANVMNKELSLPMNGANVQECDNWEPLVGYWQGILNGELRLIYRITHICGQVFIYSLDQGGFFVPATATSFKDKSKDIHFFFDTIGGVYRATLDQTDQRMSGTWKQGPGTFPLDYSRFQPTSDDEVPREIRFAVEKAVTGDTEQLVEMEGYWSGYLDDSFDQEEKEPPVFVILQVERLSKNLVEPKLYLPDDSPLPNAIRSFMVNKADGKTKIVLDRPGNGNAIFEGQLDGKTISGTVKYDDTDQTPPLTLVWSKKRPDNINEVH